MAVERLTKYLKPKKYQLAIDINRSKTMFKGSVLIEGVRNSSYSFVKIHSKKLIIKNILVNNEVTSYEIENNDQLKINLNSPIKRNIAIKIEFRGKITKEMHGIYPCFTANNEIILATQLESHYAREVFPCIDEPEAKAFFELTLLTDNESTILSNTEIKNQYKDRNKIITVFEQTPKMSTYLLAFVVGDLQSISAKTKNGTQINVWSSKDHSKKDLEFALDVAVRTTEFFNDYFQTPYPLKKCDHVALPDFNNGAMENWGLITYREIYLIANKDATSQDLKENIATVIAHEISHQWFGNLVTMSWWDDLWLNESFATLMEYIAVDNLFPEWNIMFMFSYREALGAFRRDMLSGIQPVGANVNHPDEISTLFDPSIVYAKGARLLYMIYNLVGDRAFRKGLKDYFNNYAYSNTTGKDLWLSLDKYSEEDISKIIPKWIKNPGFPILSVNNINNNLKLSQSKFNSSENTIWPIPLFANQKTEISILNTKNKNIKTNNTNKLILNTKGGHYLVHYQNKENLEYISEQIKAGKLSTTQKLLFLNDLSLQAKIGLISIVEILNLLQNFKNEDSAPVWSVISMIISDTRKLIQDNDKAESKLRIFVWELIKVQYKKISWTDSKKQDYNLIKLREIILGLSLYSERDDAINSAKYVYKKYSKVNSIPSNIRSIVLSAIVKFDGNSSFDNLLALYPREKNPETQLDIINALTSSKDIKQLSKILNNLKKKDWIKTQDVISVFFHLLGNKYSLNQAWIWMKKNWDWIEYTFAGMSLDDFPRYCASAFIGKSWLDEYNSFFKPLKKMPELQRNIVIGEADIKTKNKWYDRDHRKIVKWLDSIVSD